MASKKYGGLTGEKVKPSPSAAPGAWTSTSEVYREKTANNWPLAVSAADLVAPVGSIVLATTSGVVDSVLNVPIPAFVLASGSSVAIADYGDLFAVYGTTFGGNGITNFQVPDLFDKHIYFKGVTASGTTPVYGSGNLPDHTHTAYRRVNPGSSGGNTTTSNTRAEMTGGVVNVDTSFDTDKVNTTGDNNEMNKRELIPLVSALSDRIPVGCAFPVLWPGASGTYPTYDVGRFLIPSGQEVARSTYPALFDLIGVHYGSGDTSTTFNLPDLRGIFLSSSRQPPTVLQPSGDISPSGFLPSAFVRHAHVYPSNYASTRNGDFSGTQYILPYRSTTPATSEFSGGPESRAANMSVIYFLCVG